MILIPVVLVLFYTLAHLFLHKGISSLRRPAEFTGKLRFSVVVAARNEEKYVNECINHLLDQDYDSNLVEIIVVDDRSTDNTATIVRRFAGNDSRIKLIEINECPEGVSPKKNAVSKGVLAATGEVVLFTDADSRVPRTWIKEMARYFGDGAAFVCGLTKFYSVKGVKSALFNLQQTDFISHGIVSAAAISAGLPLNTNANNLGVRKDVFLSVNGYEGVANIVSGDDDLLLQRIASKGLKTVFAFGKSITVETRPALSLVEWWEQRKRWGSKTVYYNTTAIIFLSGVFAYYLFILGYLIFSPLGASVACIGILMFVHKTFTDAILFFRGSVKLEFKYSVKWFFLLAIIHIPAIVLAVIFGVFGKFRWKDGFVKRRI